MTLQDVTELSHVTSCPDTVIANSAKCHCQKCDGAFLHGASHIWLISNDHAVIIDLHLPQKDQKQKHLSNLMIVH